MLEAQHFQEKHFLKLVPLPPHPGSLSVVLLLTVTASVGPRLAFDWFQERAWVSCYPLLHTYSWQLEAPPCLAEELSVAFPFSLLCPCASVVVTLESKLEMADCAAESVTLGHLELV